MQLGGCGLWLCPKVLTMKHFLRGSIIMFRLLWSATWSNVKFWSASLNVFGSKWDSYTVRNQEGLAIVPQIYSRNLHCCRIRASSSWSFTHLSWWSYVEHVAVWGENWSSYWECIVGQYKTIGILSLHDILEEFLPNLRLEILKQIEK